MREMVRDLKQHLTDESIEKKTKVDTLCPCYQDMMRAQSLLDKIGP